MYTLFSNHYNLAQMIPESYSYTLPAPHPSRGGTLPNLAIIVVNWCQFCEFLTLARKQAEAAAVRLRVDIAVFKLQISFLSWTPPVRVPSPAPEMTLKKNSSAKKAAFEKQTYTNKASNALRSHLTLTC